MELFGKSLAIVDFPERPDLVGVGLSDWDGLAWRLAKKLGYANTYYHKEPLLDIAAKQGLQHDLYDFIISSDVFEHVCPPISTAFVNAYNLLKAGGVMILTVPYTNGFVHGTLPQHLYVHCSKRRLRMDLDRDDIRRSDGKICESCISRWPGYNR